jgi:signal transduction histidine kinase
LVYAVPVLRSERSAAALALRIAPGARKQTLELAAEAAVVLGWILDRETSLEHSGAAAEQTLAALLEGESRIAYDLHDGALQDLAALASALHRFREQLEGALADEKENTRLVGAVDGLEARIVHIDSSLRAVAQDGALRASATEPFTETLRGVAQAFRATSGIGLQVDLDEGLELLAESQRTVIARFVQEALRNVARHSGADEARVRVVTSDGALRVEVADNGRGFDVKTVRRRSAATGRLGLRSMEQRARLLGGTVEVGSSEGGPTSIVLALPTWRSRDPRLDEDLGSRAIAHLREARG